ncbi:MAG: RdgB/HAM1 family non-canonical purine NTP pyrophosphatase [Candidatus Thermoplasmatota archaeon]|nr:RdgB/HAM1 family non-canonical purine NTP pyrophosphatase [Candidatus Thermoplasmatota archaeon]MCL5731234.1 RdgB/HAM1 family non-canonical purine NTP pyrophosphatase [Candidatus Thermoplasmatota archaeon]
MISFVTSNEHKFHEVSVFMKEVGMEVTWVKMKYEEIQDEDVKKVSLLSMKSLQGVINGDFFIEDTGLFIADLKGFPGAYASYVQKTIGNDGILKLLEGRESEAYFETCISLSLSGKISQFTGTLKGRMATTQTGKSGFGYDPIFIPEGEKMSLAQIETSRKNEISHRGRALREMVNFLRNKGVV